MQGVIAGTLVAGLDLERRGWVTHASAGSNIAPIPALDGELVFDPALLAAAADDFGHIVHRLPWAVLYPGSVDDVVAMVRYAVEHGVDITGMSKVGDTHSTFGQSQAHAGIVVNMASLAQIHEINADDAVVDAGVRWEDLMAATFTVGKSPPALTDYTGLSVGGTLSVGGIGGHAYLWGMQVNNVIELEVVTGTGELVVCSAQRNRRLFDLVRGGLGQFGIIVRARVRLREVPPLVRFYKLAYRDVRGLTADQELLIERERFDYIEGGAVPGEGGQGWTYYLEAARYFEPGDPPDDDDLLAGLCYESGTAEITDMGFLDFVYRLEPVIDLLKNIGLWGLPHPWLNLFLPGDMAPWLIETVLADTPATEMGGGPILIYPFRRSEVPSPYPVLPRSETCYLFSLLRTAIPGTAENVEHLVARNREIFERVRACGGTLYPISAVPMTSWDWRLHFWPWFDFLAAKRRYDPEFILTPGQDIFDD